MEKAKDIESERERERSNMMYDAWQKSQEKDMNPKSQGVTVVKTLQKSVRKDRTNKDDASDKRNEAIQLLKEAANKFNHPEAAVQLGNVLLKQGSRGIDTPSKEQNGANPKDSVTQAKELFQQAGDAGSRVGWYNLGHLLWTGFPPSNHADEDGEEENASTRAARGETEGIQILASDMEGAMAAFKKAIELGDSDAMYLVGVQRLSDGDSNSYRDGIDLIEKAANAGHGGALYYLALLYLNGEPEIELEPCSFQEFVNRLDRAVDAGSVDARFIRGNSFYRGTEGYPQDFKRALEDFLQAADDGHADAAVSAGAMFHNGVGVLKDQQKAFELYQQGGELGSEEGWMNVVDCWQRGLGVPKSEETARHIKNTMLKGRI